MRFFAVVPLLVLTGCGMGALGQATLSDPCRAEESTCKKGGLDAPVAVGATVEPEVRLELRGSGTPAAHYTAVGDDVLVADRGVLRGKAPGVTAVLLRTDTGTVLDFFHVWVKAPTHLKLFQVMPAGAEPDAITTRLELLPGESVRLAASLFGDGQPLAGRAEQTWSIDKPIVAILAEGHEGRRRLVALEPGSATLKVRSLDQTAIVQVVVHPEVKK
jgi:hypothetical protein